MEAAAIELVQYLFNNFIDKEPGKVILVLFQNTL
jgi:hypothetical protein